MNKYYPDHNTTESEEFAKREINEMSLPEFIHEIKKVIKPS